MVSQLFRMHLRILVIEKMARELTFDAAVRYLKTAVRSCQNISFVRLSRVRRYSVRLIPLQSTRLRNYSAPT